ncbi:uncharacterized protein LOC111339145 [Stylophora pistillata]|uniref:uncharacterized protein LOC111339145 n=1 Tax=Stylophora pistillata TaxID=50429 RepID=UPI000C038B4B|nr:uncharacterized protein LOC111339145 [Stylophora pistillata]
MAFSGFHVFMIMVHVVVVFQSANSLSCNKCTSETSWADCNSKMNKFDCPSGSPNCVTGTATCTSLGEDTKTVYYKRCGAPGDDCGPKADDTPTCSSSSSIGWSYSSANSCCSGDNCNSGSFHRINKAGLGMCLAIIVLALRLILAERF